MILFSKPIEENQRKFTTIRSDELHIELKDAPLNDNPRLFRNSVGEVKNWIKPREDTLFSSCPESMLDPDRNAWRSYCWTGTAGIIPSWIEKALETGLKPKLKPWMMFSRRNFSLLQDWFKKAREIKLRLGEVYRMFLMNRHKIGKQVIFKIIVQELLFSFR